MKKKKEKICEIQKEFDYKIENTQLKAALNLEQQKTRNYREEFKILKTEARELKVKVRQIVEELKNVTR